MASRALLAESDEDDDAGEADHSDVFDRAMRRADTVMPVQIEQRAMSLEDRRFVTISGAMWEGQWLEQFENMPRPEIDKISMNLEKIETDYRENRLSVEFIASDDADKDTANTINDMFRADAHNFKAQQAWDNAFQEGIRGGFGAWRLATDYADPYDDDSDEQRVNPGLTIVDADQSVYFDPASILYDASDAKWAFVISAWARADAVDKWGQVADFPVSKEWAWTWEWYRPDATLIAEYYEVESVGDELWIFTQKQSGEEQRYYKSEMLDGQAAELKNQGWSRKSRGCKRKRVRKYLMSGQAILKDLGYIAGDCIPIVPFYYRRDYVDNMPRWRGYVSKYKDPQRVYNSAVAKVIETNSISAQQTPIIYAEQMNATTREQWSRRNVDRLSHLEKLMVYDADGSPVPMQMEYLDPPQVQPAAAALLQIASNDLTDNDDQTDQVAANVSAEAIELAQNRVDSKSGIALDNFRQSQLRCGEIYMSMGREAYYEPGRKVDTMSNDGQDGQAELQEPVIDQSGIYRIRNDLTKGRFKVSASVTESTVTKRQKAARQSMELGASFMQAQSPTDALACFYTAAENFDGEGMDDLIAYFRQKSIGIGATKPTAEEQQAIEQAQQSKAQQPPDPKEVALQQQVQEIASKTALNQAKVQQTLAKARLETAQSTVLEKAPAVPQGLANAPETPNPVDQVATIADAHAKVASANLDNAKADHLHETIRHQRIKTGAELAAQAHGQTMDVAGHQLAVRQQEHVEAQPAGTKGE